MLAVLSLLVFVSLVAWHGWSVLANSWTVGARSNSSLAVPLAIPQALWWIGYGWFVLCGLVLLLRGALAFGRADWNDVNRLIGARSIEEEAADELSSAVQSLGAGKP
jgi:TRAP-type mannitol/chloroaromatic compound transport system permease small subunit